MEKSDLKNAITRLLHDSACRARFRVPVDEIDPGDRAALVDELESFFLGAEEAVAAYVDLASMAGESAVYAALHGKPGVDNEMLEQAIEFNPVKR
jgi:hypothetical protein